MNIDQMGGAEVYIKYLALTSKDYTIVPFANKHKSVFNYYEADGAANWGYDLFHYCTIETFRSITEKNNKEDIEARLRFSDIRFLNDTTEFKEAVRLLKVAIEKEKSSMDKELYKLLTDRNIFTELDKYFQRYPFEKPINQNKNVDSILPVCRIYTCSFSMDGDLLPMWNYYAHGIGGLSINFRELKENMQKNDKVKLVWGKVWYEEDDKIQCIEAFLKDIIELFHQIPDINCREEMIQTVLINAINNMRLFMKNEKFSTEKEYRAVLIVPDEIIKTSKLPEKYKSGHFNRGNIIIPYIDVPFESDSIKNVIVGSGATDNFALIKLGLEDWLSKQDLNNINIYQSSIPLRKY